MKFKCRKIILFSAIVLPLVFAGCKKPDNDIPKVKSIEQSVALNNDVEIKYSATLSNVEKAKLNVKKDGVLISTEEISDVSPTGADYQKTYSYTFDPRITKGNYEFTLTSENPSDNLEKTNSIGIPNYVPSFNTSGINFNFVENSETTISLSKLVDKNPEDNPVSVTGVKSPDGKTQATLKTTTTGYDINIKGLPNAVGAYQLEFDFKNAEGTLDNIILGGQIAKDTRIVINPLICVDDNGAEYNSLTTKLDRDNYILAKLKLNNGSNVPFSFNPPYYNCANYSLQLFVDSKKLGEKIHSLAPNDWSGKYWLYNNYKGNNLDSIYKNGGTLENMGTIGAPIIEVGLVDTSHYIHNSSYFGHGMNAILTGNDLTKWEDWNFIEPQNDQTKLQPGQADIPRDCDEVFIGYLYLVKDQIQGNYLKSIDLVKFRIENGTPILIWENNDPKFNIIKQRGK